MKSRYSLTMSALAAVACLYASGAGIPPAANAQTPGEKRPPSYVVYRHFLSWVNQLDRKASAAEPNDPYKFAEPFNRSHLTRRHLDLIRNEAYKMTADLAEKDSAAQTLIARYRVESEAAVREGRPLPAPAPELIQLEREHTAILVQHYTALRSALGADGTSLLDNYLNYEFVPRVKMRRMSPPAKPVSH